MRILVIADVHGKFEILQKIINRIENERFDIIIAPGDFTDMFDVPPNFTQTDVADIVIQKLLIPNKPLLCVPGNHDPFEIIDTFNEYDINLHNREILMKGTTFVGWGGARTPFNTLFEPGEEETKETLLGMTNKISKDWVLITHAPPKGTILDVVQNKHVGSDAIREVILQKKPRLAICAHIHENSGTERINGTTIFYPGPAYKGYYGMVLLGDGAPECHIKKVNV
jgi:Icc-related predicted phosphoesterase